MSLVTGSNGMDYCVEDLLKNFEFRGQRLSEIRHQSLKKSKKTGLRKHDSLRSELLETRSNNV